jgi:hypothetical protein
VSTPSQAAKLAIAWQGATGGLAIGPVGDAVRPCSMRSPLFLDAAARRRDAERLMVRRLRAAWRALGGYTAAGDLRSSGSSGAVVRAAPPPRWLAPRRRAARRARARGCATTPTPRASSISATGNAVGAGITHPLARVPAHADAWRRWAESTACDAERRLDLYGLQALAMRAVVESGECFIRLLPADITPANPIGLRLQVLESDHLDTTRTGLLDGLATLNGIGLDDAGALAGRPGCSPATPATGGRACRRPDASAPVDARDVLDL